MMFEAYFLTDEDEEPLDVPHHRVGFSTPGGPRLVERVLVEKAGTPLLILDIYLRHDDAFFRKRALIWNNWIVVGIGQQVSFVHMVSQAAIIHRLEGYFSELYPGDDLLLIASACDLHCINADGRPLWASPQLGVDGVIVEDIQDGVVSGSGEWDPPGGWQPFRVSLATGELLPSI